MYKSIYINITESTKSWIIGSIAEDIKSELLLLGFDCDLGSNCNQNAYDVCLNMSYAYAKPHKNAKHNSVFVTHIDDKLKEISVKNSLIDFDSIICMSIDDAKTLISLGIPENKVFGIPLPIRSSMIKPYKIGIFSASYKDGRKNENWLLDFFNEGYDLKNIIFVFIGNGWGSFVNKLEENDLSFEWHRTSSNVHSEYLYQQNKLESLDSYFYLGFDGGAMGTYDAYFRGIKLMVAEGSYHDDIPDGENRIKNYNDFKNSLNNIIKAHQNKIDFFESNTLNSYVNNLISAWNNNLFNNLESFNKDEFLKTKRSKYSRLSIRRLASYCKQVIYKMIKK